MTIEVKHLINAPIKKVWSALTNPNEMRHWYFDSIKAFKPEVGFSTIVTMQSDTTLFTAHWDVIEVIPGTFISYTWTFEGYDGIGDVSFLLSEKEGKTLVKVIDIDLEPWSQDVPEFSPESCKAGWEYFIKQQLPNYFKTPKNEGYI